MKTFTRTTLLSLLLFSVLSAPVASASDLAGAADTSSAALPMRDGVRPAYDGPGGDAPGEEGTAGPVTRNGNLFEAEGASRRADGKSCIYAASRAFVAAWDACDAAQYTDCNGSRPLKIEAGADYCHVKSVVTGSMTGSD